MVRSLKETSSGFFQKGFRMKTNIGITKADSAKVIEILSNYLADSYYLYIKTHNFHWNVTGMHFQNLHKLFDEQYSALFESIDNIAERIRSLGEFVPATFAQLKELTCLKEKIGRAHV